MISATPFIALSNFELLIAGGIFGLIIGSFLSMLSWRLPRLLMAQYQYDALEAAHELSQQTDSPASFGNSLKEPTELDYDPEKSILNQLSVGGSKCPNCHKRLRWFQLIPLFSWLGTGGKCYHCGAKISARYPMIELFSALTSMLILWLYQFSEVGLFLLAFNYLLITISVIDLEHQLILDGLSLPLLWLGLIFNSLGGLVSLQEALWGAILGYVLLWSVFHAFRLLTGKEGMGYGDFKMLAALGAWLGVAMIPQIILIAAIASIVIGLGAVVLRLRKYDQPLAFGPYLALGGWASLFLGNMI